MIDREQILWHRAVRLSFVWKKQFIEWGQEVSPERRQGWAELMVEIFRMHGLPEELE